MLGDKLFTWIVKRSFYAQFVAGEDEKSIKPKIDHLKSFGVKAIFDYSAEEDMNEEAENESVDNDKNQPQVELPSTGVDEQVFEIQFCNVLSINRIFVCLFVLIL